MGQLLFHSSDPMQGYPPQFKAFTHQCVIYFHVCHVFMLFPLCWEKYEQCMFCFHILIALGKKSATDTKTFEFVFLQLFLEKKLSCLYNTGQAWQLLHGWCLRTDHTVPQSINDLNSAQQCPWKLLLLANAESETLPKQIWCKLT